MVRVVRGGSEAGAGSSVGVKGACYRRESGRGLFFTSVAFKDTWWHSQNYGQGSASASQESLAKRVLFWNQSAWPGARPRRTAWNEAVPSLGRFGYWRLTQGPWG